MKSGFIYVYIKKPSSLILTICALSYFQDNKWQLKLFLGVREYKYGVLSITSMENIKHCATDRKAIKLQT